MKPKNNNKKNSGYVQLGAILKSKEGSLYIKFDQNAEVIINGVNVSGGTASLEKPTEKFGRMVAAGKMTEDEAEERIAAYSEGGKLEYVRQEISVKLG